MPGTFHSHIPDRRERFQVDSTLITSGVMILVILLLVILFFGFMVTRAS
jgi:hypothetical protein